MDVFGSCSDGEVAALLSTDTKAEPIEHVVVPEVPKNKQGLAGCVVSSVFLKCFFFFFFFKSVILGVF